MHYIQVIINTMAWMDIIEIVCKESDIIVQFMSRCVIINSTSCSCTTISALHLEYCQSLCYSYTVTRDDSQRSRPMEGTHVVRDGSSWENRYLTLCLQTHCDHCIIGDKENM